MKLVVVGINHKTAPVAMRERLAFGGDLPSALQSLTPITDGAVIVSTCNRTEIYAYLPDDGDFETIIDDDGKPSVDPKNRLTEWLANFKQLALADFAQFLYIYTGNRALTHWLRVAVGLDSMILGEPQILGQIKQAVTLSHTEQAMSAAFDSLTQKIFASARIVRRDTALGKQAVTLGFATAKLVTQIFDNPTKTTLLVVAAGEMNRLVAHNVANLGMERVIICNRSRERAETLATELLTMAANAGRTVDVEIFGLDVLGEKLCQADIVTSCSGSMHALIDGAMVKTAMKVRKHRPLLMVDLAVPRDIEPVVAKFDGVYLYSIDDLQYVIQGNLEERKQAAVEAEILVSQLASEIEADMQVQAMGKTIAQYQATAHAKSAKLLAHALSALEKGDDPKQVLEIFAHQLTNTLTHPPKRLLRATSGKFDEDVLGQMTEALLGAYRG